MAEPLRVRVPATERADCCVPNLSLARSSARRVVLARRVRLLVAATITYNVVEAVVALSAGAVANSTALVGFGLDSVIEVSSAGIVAWQFSAADPEARERTALRVITASFVVLAVFVSVESMRALLGGSDAEHTTIGIILAALSLAVMPGLSWAQRRTGVSSAPRLRSQTRSRRCCAPTSPPSCSPASW